MSSGLTDMVYRHLHEKLASGYLSPGVRLVDRAVATELGISPTPVRAAFNRLISEGALRHLPNIGVFVPANTRREIEDIYEFREILEVATVDKVCGTLSQDVLAEMQACITQQAQILDKLHGEGNSFQDPAFAEPWRLSDETFHAAFLRAAGNRYVMQTINRLRSQVHLVYRTGFSWKKTYNDHRRILAALERGDSAEARRTISVHIRNGREFALKACDEHYMDDAQGQPSLAKLLWGPNGQEAALGDEQVTKADVAIVSGGKLRQRSSGRLRKKTKELASNRRVRID